MAFTPAEARVFLREKEGAVYPERSPLEVSARHLPGEPLRAAEAVNARFEPFAVGGEWGAMWGTTWFRLRGEVPGQWRGREVVALVDLGGDDVVGFSAEGLVWSIDLQPLQGLHHEHREVPVPGAEADFYVEAAANPIPRWHKKEWPLLAPDYSGPPLYTLRQAELALVDRQAEAFLLEAEIAVEIAEWMGGRGLAELERALALFGEGRVAEARACLGAARKPGGPGEGRRHTVTAVGHAHIDTAWLWPVRETRRKVARTFANQLRLLEDCPDHRFVASQAVQYLWVKEDHPELYRRVREAVRSGRWEPVGGMWVEPDANLPCGESLVRQVVHGKRFFLRELGVEARELWIPDVFGYPASLPQIASQAGVDALVTQKMSWNDTNTFPRSSFWWEGHDGTRILAHFPPADTYNGTFSVPELLGDQRNFKDSERSAHTLYPYGHGDGGGGPTRRMVERARRLADVEGLPRVEIGSLRGFLDALRADSATLKTWVGELYLEYHRGTYTTHADVKLANRRAEEALRQAEMWSVAAGLDTAGQTEPLWELLLLNQFHDILPGSGIHWVYEDAAVDHAAVLGGARQVIEQAQAVLAGRGDQPMLFNPSSYDRREVLDLPGRGPSLVSVGACGWAPAEPLEADPVAVGDRWMDNGVLRVEWDSSGLLRSVWDHEAGREALSGAANLFQLHEDQPKAFDAWDVDREYLDRCTDLTGLDASVVAESHPLRAAVRFERSFGRSRITQVMRLAAGSRRLEFHTEVDWREDHRFLKVAFPVAVRSARAAYEIQHGWVERPTVENTSWDEARFEVCAHRWADLSEPGYGVALLNDCKYGYDIRSSTMRLSLLRAPTYPDPLADRGRHRFTYALYPHPGAGRVAEEAEALNLPVAVRRGSGEAGRAVRLDREGVSVEAVKPAYDGGGVVVRICEVRGSRGPVSVEVCRPWSKVQRTDLLERPVETLAAPTVSLRPFELVTLLFS